MGNYRDIAFGFSSAEAERSKDPGLIEDGYIDFKKASELALNGAEYLFLGYKGAGKSTIGERIKLSLSDSYNNFVQLIPLANFPFTPFSKVVRGNAEPETKYPTAWSWILLIYILDSFAGDESTTHHDMPQFQDAIAAFRKMGFAPGASPADIVRTTAKNSFKLALPGKLAEYTWAQSESRPAAEIPDFVESLKRLVCGIESESRHYLIIDGLDDILSSREVQFKSLSALIFEVARLNEMFVSAQVPAKIVVLCRTDIFDKIPGPNKNKTRQDYAVELDWYHDPAQPQSSMLVQLAQLRAKRSLGQSVDLFRDLFAQKIKGIEPERYLLDNTRHTPRDFLQLLAAIQQFAGDSRLVEKPINSGLREYSIKYFLPEIRDELSGYAEPDEIERLFKLLSRLSRREFNFSELAAAAESSVKPFSRERIYELCELLFECSAIGNVQNRPGKSPYYTFKYRNRQSAFAEHQTIMIHRGLWKALNIT